MKIKLALLDNDVNYLNKMVTALNTKYPDKFEVYSFTAADSAIGYLVSARIDVFIANVVFNIDPKIVPEECGFAYLSDNIGVETLNGERAVSKYQKVDLTYRQILSIYAEKSAHVTGFADENGKGKIIVFSSPYGGAGTSTIAASCAVNLAAEQKKVLYLNLEKFGGADDFFSAEGQFDFSDVIFALKSKKSNLAVKLESCIKQDAGGVFFYSQPKMALDMLELGYSDMIRLLNEIKITGEYEYILVDIDFSLSEDAMSLYQLSRSWVWVSDGTLSGNMKTKRAHDALTVMDQNNNTRMCDRLLLVYNKYDKHSSKIEEANANTVGVIPYSNAWTTKQVIEKIAHLDIFKKIIGQ